LSFTPSSDGRKKGAELESGAPKRTDHIAKEKKGSCGGGQNNTKQNDSQGSTSISNYLSLTRFSKIGRHASGCDLASLNTTSTAYTSRFREEKQFNKSI
jgi:hypothetical protein